MSVVEHGELIFVGSYWRAGGDTARELSPLARALRGFKAGANRAAGRRLAALFADHIAPRSGGFATIVPIPTDATRLRERRFSPAFWLARELSRRSGVPLAHRALRRREGAVHQRGRSGADRRRNAQHAYSVDDGHRLESPTLLVDDVYTTGATLAAAADALRSASRVECAFAVLVCADERLRAQWEHRIDSAGI